MQPMFILEKLSIDEIHAKYYQQFDDTEFYEIISVDPFFDPSKGILGPYGKPLLELAKKDPSWIKTPDNREWARSVVRRLDLLSKGNMVPQPAPNLLGFRSLEAMDKAVASIEHDNFKVIHSEPGKLVIRTVSKRANEFFGCNAGWCTTWDNESHFNRYSSGGILINLTTDWDGVWSAESISDTSHKVQFYCDRDGSGVEIKDADNAEGTSFEDFLSELDTAGADFEAYLVDQGIDMDKVKEASSAATYGYYSFFCSPVSGRQRTRNDELYVYEEPYGFEFNMELQNDQGDSVETWTFDGLVHTAMGEGHVLSYQTLIDLDVSPFIPFMVFDGDRGMIRDFIDSEAADHIDFDTNEHSMKYDEVKSYLGTLFFGGFVFPGVDTDTAAEFIEKLHVAIPDWDMSVSEGTIVETDDGAAYITNDAQRYNLDSFFDELDGDPEGSYSDAKSFLEKYGEEMEELDSANLEKLRETVKKGAVANGESDEGAEEEE